jgi:RecA-family ATPase
MATLLQAAFQPGEGVAIGKAKVNGEGRCIPDGAGTVFSRDAWLDKLDAHGGNADDLFASPHGVFVRVNPLRLGGSTDADVTAFRHALVEFDQQSMQEQWAVISQSGVPCSAILTSGNRSLHAWVRVDAKDATEYAERVSILYDHFSHYGVDVKNRNPSRFSRLPGVRRGDGRQELLAVGTGAENWKRWLADAAAAGIGEEFPIAKLLSFKADEDPNSIIGDRWVCRGGSVLWVGQSGIGKSSLGMQAAITWAMGKPFFGITPARPLKSLVIQGENDLGDASEMLQGVLRGAFAEALQNDAQRLGESLSQRLTIVRLQTHVGRAFADAAAKLISKHEPDLVWIDPLFSFFGDDVSNQKACSQFLREWLNPIASATGVVWMLLHHTGKPVKDPRAYSNWKSNDFSYMGTGSAELVNWARATCFIKGLDDGVFALMLTKRGPRAGAMDLDGERTTDVFLRHSDRGICWEQVSKEEAGIEPEGPTLEGFIAEIQSEGVELTVSTIIPRVENFFKCKKSAAYAKRNSMIAKGLLRLLPGDTYEVIGHDSI